MSYLNKFRKILFNFSMIYFYSFLSGILVSISANLFTEILISDLTPSQYSSTTDRAIISVFFLLSSLAAFNISTILDHARKEWELEGHIKSPDLIRKMYIEKGNRILFLWIYFILIFLFPLSVFIYIKLLK